MIIANNPDFPITPRFYSELSSADKTIVDNLKTFALTKVLTIKYMVFTSLTNNLDLEPNEGDVVSLDVNTLSASDKAIIDAYTTMCNTLLNS